MKGQHTLNCLGMGLGLPWVCEHLFQGVGPEPLRARRDHVARLGSPLAEAAQCGHVDSSPRLRHSKRCQAWWQGDLVDAAPVSSTTWRRYKAICAGRSLQRAPRHPEGPLWPVPRPETPQTKPPTRRAWSARTLPPGDAPATGTRISGCLRATRSCAGDRDPRGRRPSAQPRAWAPQGKCLGFGVPRPSRGNVGRLQPGRSGAESTQTTPGPPWWASLSNLASVHPASPHRPAFSFGSTPWLRLRSGAGAIGILAVQADLPRCRSPPVRCCLQRARPSSGGSGWDGGGGRARGPPLAGRQRPAAQKPGLQPSTGRRRPRAPGVGAGPKRAGVRPRGPAASQGHSFRKVTLTKPTFCHLCSDFIWGLAGFLCDVCNFMSHEKCLKHVKTPCTSVAPSLVWAFIMQLKQKGWKTAQD
ncbi:translation initiation factor IF-2-like [Nycticebus coucang]|uniref:translation initiation factor IF-2-like n=1 Tax=Nycticebus coucang TaxID=9470 RepID=UPI00234D5BB1|nr:translation initiation factor IF-2-like [Nycticebus coucang]